MRSSMPGVLKRTFHFKDDKFFSPDRLDQAIDEIWSSLNLVAGDGGLTVEVFRTTVAELVKSELGGRSPTQVNIDVGNPVVERLITRVAALEDRKPEVVTVATPSPPASMPSDVEQRFTVVNSRLEVLGEKLAAHVANKSNPHEVTPDQAGVRASLDYEPRLVFIEKQVADLSAVPAVDLSGLSARLLALEAVMKRLEQVLEG
jgi:hypothetical protein